MRKAFTKTMVETIEEKFKVKLTEEQINAGYVELEYKNGFGSTKEVKIGRSTWDNKFVTVTANFKGDNYKYLNGTVENEKLKQMLKKI